MCQIVGLVLAASVASYQDWKDIEHSFIIGARKNGHRIFDVGVKFGFRVRQFHNCTLNIRYVEKYQITNFNSARKNIPWFIDDWWESLNEVEVQHFLKLPGISMFRHKQVTACKLFIAMLSEPKAQSRTILDCTEHSLALGLGQPTLSLDFWQLESRCLV